MVIQKPGPVTDKITLLGSKESNVYLWGDEQGYALLGGGFSYLLPSIFSQLEKFKINPEKIKNLVILHAHFDHCGIAPEIKSRFPWIKILASQRANQLLFNPDIAKSIKDMNILAAERMGRKQRLMDYSLEFQDLIEETLAEGDQISLGNNILQVLEVPGHSSCSIALYDPEEKALFASDSGGIPLGDDVFTAANSNIDNYIKSLAKMLKYEVAVFLAEHYGARTGEDAREFLQKSAQSAKQTKEILIESYSRTQDIQQSSQEIMERMYQNLPQDFLPKEIVSMVLGQMLKYIAKNY